VVSALRFFEVAAVAAFVVVVELNVEDELEGFPVAAAVDVAVFVFQG